MNFPDISRNPSAGYVPAKASAESHDDAAAAADSQYSVLPILPASRGNGAQKKANEADSPDVGASGVFIVFKLLARFKQHVWGRMNEIRHDESVLIEKAGLASVKSVQTRGWVALGAAVVGGVGQTVGAVVQVRGGLKASSEAIKAGKMSTEASKLSAEATSLSEQAKTLKNPADIATVEKLNSDAAEKSRLADMKMKGAETHSSNSHAISATATGYSGGISGLATLVKSGGDFAANESDAERARQDLASRRHENNLQANDTSLRQQQDDEREALQTGRSMLQTDQDLQRRLAGG